MYGTRMREAGWQVEETDAGDKALAVATRFQPDVIVTDLNLPTLDGVAATQALKEDPLTAQVPVIVISGFLFRSYEAYAAGCHTFLSKPCLPETLLEIMEQIVGDAEVSSSKP